MRLHECVQGPFCEEMDRFLEAMSPCDDPMCREYGCYCPDPSPLIEECDHLSCQAIVHQPCEQCFIDTMEAMYSSGEM
jgi:hypothetical protein